MAIENAQQQYDMRLPESVDLSDELGAVRDAWLKATAAVARDGRGRIVTGRAGELVFDLGNGVTLYDDDTYELHITVRGPIRGEVDKDLHFALLEMAGRAFP